MKPTEQFVRVVPLIISCIRWFKLCNLCTKTGLYIGFSIWGRSPERVKATSSGGGGGGGQSGAF